MEKQELVQSEKQLSERRMPLFKRQTASKGELAIKAAADYALLIPGIVEAFIPDTRYVVDMSSEISAKLLDGSLEFMTKKSGEAMAIIRDPQTKDIVKNLTIKAESYNPMLGPTMIAASLFIQMKKMEKSLDDLSRDINDVLKNFENDRYARAFSAKEKFEQAMLFKNQQLKNDYLISVLSDVTNTKHMLYKQLTTKVEKLVHSKSLFYDKTKTDLANQILENLYLFNESFKIQIQCYTELEEYYSLSHALDLYEQEVAAALPKEIQLSVDGYFEKPDNPFSSALSDIINNIYQTNNFLLDNETMLLNYTHEPAYAITSSRKRRCKNS